MHLADGIVAEPGLLLGAAGVSAVTVALAARVARARDPRTLAWSGLLAAFVLAAQAVNVPLLPGTSAHVVGATLVTLVLGPARGILAMTAVLLVQALLLGDGGIAALGVNVLDLAILPVLAVEGVARVAGRHGSALTATAVLGTVAGSALGAASLSAVLVLGAGAEPRRTFVWLVGLQALSGVVEGGLTAAALTRLERRAPGLVAGTGNGPATRGPLVWAAAAVLVAAALAPLASAAPDALERLLPSLSGR